jgi:AbrB family looped-hinge helix DNA binding protein
MTSLDTSGTARVGPKGQIVIPKAMRDRVGLQPGATVFLDQAVDGTITLEFGWNGVMDAPAYFARYPVLDGEEGRTSLDTLHAIDAEDEAILDRKLGPWPKS